MDGIHVAFIDQGLLGGRERATENADHCVLPEEGLGPSRSLAVVAVMELDKLRGDPRQDLARYLLG
jgi:hypothetical protein